MTRPMTPLTRHFGQVKDWENERRARIDAYAEALTHLNAAARVLPPDKTQTIQDVRWATDRARGRLRAVFDEVNPYVEEQRS